MVRYLLTNPGPRPPCFKVAVELWGPHCDYDSDGNSDNRDDHDWTELTVSLRDDRGETSDSHRVDVDPVGGGAPLVLAIKSENQGLARRVAEFLQREAGGELSEG